VTARPVQRPSASPRSLRCAHLAAVLDHLATGGPQSRARIADALGLSRASTTAIASQLLAAGAVVEHGRANPGERGGRPGELLMLHPHAAVAVGVPDDEGVLRLVARFLDGRTVIRDDAAPTSPLELWPTLVTSWHAVAPAPVSADGAHAAGGPTELAALAESESAGIPAGFIALDRGVRIGAGINGLAMPSARAASPHRPATRPFAKVGHSPRTTSKHFAATSSARSKPSSPASESSSSPSTPHSRRSVTGS
jgi:hypothetical protein